MMKPYTTKGMNQASGCRLERPTIILQMHNQAPLVHTNDVLHDIPEG